MIKKKRESVKSIEWHEECIKNSTRYKDELVQTKGRLEKEIQDIISKNIIYQTQVDLAKIRGLKEFDRDRFGMKRFKF